MIFFNTRRKLKEAQELAQTRMETIGGLVAHNEAVELANHRLWSELNEVRIKAKDKHEENVLLRVALADIVLCETPKANGTVTRIAQIARKALGE